VRGVSARDFAQEGRGQEARDRILKGLERFGGLVHARASACGSRRKRLSHFSSSATS
jgi:hypothetical protein